MKLLMSRMSPFARKVRVFAREAGIDDRLEEIDVIVTPIAPNVDVSARNPLGKIPVLVRDDGSSLYDSPVICDYLDNIHENRKLIPPAGEVRWATLGQEALADGLLDAAVLLRYETVMRPEPLRWSNWIDGQQAKIIAALHALVAEVDSLVDDFTIGGVSAICALGYLDFRFAAFDWRSGRHDLAAWYEIQCKRTSVRETMHLG